MARIALTGGAYQARSLIAAAQRCVNLYPEPGAGQGEAVQMVHYPTPGLTAPLVQESGAVRGLWMANNGTLFAVIGITLYAIDSAWQATALTTIPGSNPVGMSDNGTVMVVVNGTLAGWAVTLSTLAVASIVDPAFYGADRVEYIDTFFVFNKPGTPQFYLSNSNAITFNSLYFANKTGAADNLQTVAVVHREIWLIGTYTSEVWFDSGAADFPFQAIPGALIEQGCCAKYSVAKAGRVIFWLSQDRNGARYIVKGENYQATRISTFAIEDALRGYSVVSDAIGFCYMQGGHTFYALTFPTADVTWCYDVLTGIWHERAWADDDGVLHRHRAQCAAWAYDTVIVGDHENGAIYGLDLGTYDDDGQPVQRIRSFPHMVQDGDRVMYRQFIADIETGLTAGSDDPQMALRWSDDRGRTWGNPVSLSMGKTGDYKLSVQAQRLGMARDRVWEISWSSPVRTSLTGAFIEATKAAT